MTRLTQAGVVAQKSKIGQLIDNGYDFSVPFTRQAGLAAGITPKMLRGPEFTQVLRGVWIGSRFPLTAEAKAHAALLVSPPGSHVSHLTAAELYGLPVPIRDQLHVTVTTKPDRRERIGLISHQRSRTQMRMVRGFPASTPEQLIDELADVIAPVSLAVVGDAMLAAGLCDIADMGVLARPGTASNSRNARLALSLIRDGAESPAESRVRILLTLAGLPVPVVNFAWRSPEGGERRFDMAWPEVRLIVEYDGRWHMERESQWRADLLRREEIERSGWRVIVLTAEDLRRPHQILARVHGALASRNYPGLIAEPRDRWRRHWA